MFEMICRVFKIAGNSRRKIVAGIVCNILKSFFNGFMMFGVFWILLHLDGLSPAIIGQAFGVILGSVLGRSQRRRRAARHPRREEAPRAHRGHRPCQGQVRRIRGPLRPRAARRGQHHRLRQQEPGRLQVDVLKAKPDASDMQPRTLRESRPEEVGTARGMPAPTPNRLKNRQWTPGYRLSARKNSAMVPGPEWAPMTGST